MDLFRDSGLSSTLMAERVVEENLVVLIAGQPGTVKIHNRNKQDAKCPD
jgi:hypothetical protein